MDLAMPSIDGWTVTQRAHQRWPDLRIIILSIHADEASVRRALANGAMGYILKDAPTEDLLQAVKTVMVGRRYLSPLLSERAIDVFVNGPSTSSNTADAFETLTSREREVFDLAAEGLNNNEIAAQLSISPRTAETHRANIMRKLGLRTQTDLVRYAIRRGGMEQ
jgi:two-component system response regulator NreC